MGQQALGPDIQLRNRQSVGSSLWVSPARRSTDGKPKARQHWKQPLPLLPKEHTMRAQWSGRS